jgi:hypothetical protein
MTSAWRYCSARRGIANAGPRDLINTQLQLGVLTQKQINRFNGLPLRNSNFWSQEEHHRKEEFR